MNSHQRAVKGYSTETLGNIENDLIQKGRRKNWWERQRLPYVTRELETRYHKENPIKTQSIITNNK